MTVLKERKGGRSQRQQQGKILGASLVEAMQAAETSKITKEDDRAVPWRNRTVSRREAP